jgi:type IV secretory pathway VirB10-like protein
MARSPNLKNILITLLGIALLCGVLVLGFRMAGFGVQSYLQGGEEERAGPEQRTNAQIDEQLAQLERDAGEFLDQQAEPNQPAAPGQQANAPEENPAPVDDPFARELDERALNEIRRREERRIAALSSPIGESLHSIDSIRSNREPDTVPVFPAAASGETAVSATPGVDSYSLVRPGQVLLAAGSVIPAGMIDEIRSELPGDFRAMVNNDVYGTLEAHKIIIPRGSMILGTYGDRAAVGQRRLMVEGIRVMFPNGDALDLDGSNGVDADGASGLKGRRRTGFMTAVLGTALVSFAENVGRNDTTSSDIAEAARIATGAAVGTIANSYFNEALSRGPTFDVKRGRIMNIRLDRDVYLHEYRQK